MGVQNTKAKGITIVSLEPELLQNEGLTLYHLCLARRRSHELPVMQIQYEAISTHNTREAILRILSSSIADWCKDIPVDSDRVYSLRSMIESEPTGHKQAPSESSYTDIEIRQQFIKGPEGTGREENILVVLPIGLVIIEDAVSCSGQRDVPRRSHHKRQERGVTLFVSKTAR